MTTRFFHPLKRLDIFFRLTSDFYREKEAVKLVSDFTFDVIQKRRKTLEVTDGNLPDSIIFEDNTRRKLAFLDTLIKARINGVELTNKEIADEVATFIFEGHDTTAVALTFAMYSLSLYPEIQEKIYNEQLSIYEGDVKRSPTYNEIQNMKYLELFLKEVVRLYPSVPFIGRKTKTGLDLSKLNTILCLK